MWMTGVSQADEADETLSDLADRGIIEKSGSGEVGDCELAGAE
jgi:hypothetical protein